MILYVDAKYSKQKIAIDFIKARLKNGKTVTLTWDEGIHHYGDKGFVSSRLKGVYFDDEYANGREQELIGMEIAEAGFDIMDDEGGTVYFPQDDNISLIEISVYTQEKTFVVWKNKKDIQSMKRTFL